MRLALRIISLIILAFFLLFLVFRRNLDKTVHQEQLGSYLKGKFQARFNDDSVNTIHDLQDAAAVPKGDKIIVMAKLEKDDTSWVSRELPDWQSAIYTVDPSSRHEQLHEQKVPDALHDGMPADSELHEHEGGVNLTTAHNKGHEAMAYLTYLIDNYSSPTLPAINVFLHSHRSGRYVAWHVDTPMHSNVEALQMLQLSHVQREGYVNLRCNHDPGCLPLHTKNKHVKPEIWQEISQGTSLENTAQPKFIGAACCAQFAVTKEQIRSRPLTDYEKVRDWLVQTPLTDARSGRVMEFLWHIIFGRESVHCPPEQDCYCQVYGRCNGVLTFLTTFLCSCLCNE